MEENKKRKSSKEKSRVTVKVKKKAATPISEKKDVSLKKSVQASVSEKKTASPKKKVLPINDTGRRTPEKKIFIIGVALISVFFLVWGTYVGPNYFPKQGGMEKTKEVTVQSIGVPQIGGSFQLVNQDGKIVTEADFIGKYMLVYFGYTYCPDVCPTSLTVIEEALDMLGDEASQITPIFITVYPERDNPEAMKLYVEHFHPRQVGLTGSVEQVKAVAKAYKAYFSKSGDGYDDDDYLIDHSSITYLMAPNGKFITHFSHGVEAQSMAEKISEILK